MVRRRSYATSALVAMLVATVMTSCRESSTDASRPADRAATDSVTTGDEGDTGAPDATAPDGAPTDVTPAEGDAPTTPAATAATPATPAATTAIAPAAPTTVPTIPAVPVVLDLDAATDAATVALALTEVERTIRSDGATPEQAAAAGRRQQLLYRYLSGRPEIDADVIVGVADDVRPYVQRTIQARQAVQVLRSGTQRPPPPTTLPAWRIVEPLPPDKLLAYYREAESLTGVPWYWLAAINLQETRMGRIDGVSSAGAVGPMQFLPSTWAGCCTGDPLDAREAIIGAATYLVDRGAPGDMSAALYGYNPSDAYVVLVTAYAENLRDDERTLRGYHAWQVFFESAAGDVRLPVGYVATVEIDAATYLADHPEDAAG